MTTRTLLIALLACLAVANPPAGAAITPEPLPFTESWSDVNSISVDDDWSAVPGITGYRGDGLGNGPGADPRTIAADGASTPVDVIANRTNPAALLVGGVAEFELHDSVVALQPTSTADAPHLVLRVDTTGLGSITVAYNLRDVDASIDNAAQPVALQYRVGGRGAYANVRGSFVADATSGPRLATLVTPVRAVLPPAAADKPLVEVRIITADARYSDEWVGIDDISINAVPVDRTPPSLSVSVAARQKLARVLRYGIRANVRADEPARVQIELALTARLARRLALPVVVGRSVTSLPPRVTRTIATTLSRNARRKLARLRTFRLILRATATDKAGNAAREARTIVVSR
jgi:hypothetical protein